MSRATSLLIRNLSLNETLLVKEINFRNLLGRTNVWQRKIKHPNTKKFGARESALFAVTKNLYNSFVQNVILKKISLFLINNFINIYLHHLSFIKRSHVWKLSWYYAKSYVFLIYFVIRYVIERKEFCKEYVFLFILYSSTSGYLLGSSSQDYIIMPGKSFISLWDLKKQKN